MHDNIYASQRDRVGDFVFDESVAKVFPDMIKRSVPGYASIVSATGMIAARFGKPNTYLYDLGCSLGACTVEMKAHAPKECSIVGIDSSEAMISRSSDIIKKAPGLAKAETILGDITEYEYKPASVVVMNFVLQFIPTEKRRALLQKISDSLLPGGVFLISEKFSFQDTWVQEALTELHLDFKRANGYSELEISQKRTALENVMITETAEKRLQDLKDVGFSNAGVWFQCFNFGSIIARKG